MRVNHVSVRHSIKTHHASCHKDAVKISSGGLALWVSSILLTKFFQQSEVGVQTAMQKHLLHKYAICVGNNQKSSFLVETSELPLRNQVARIWQRRLEALSITLVCLSRKIYVGLDGMNGIAIAWSYSCHTEMRLFFWLLRDWSMKTRASDASTRD